MKSKAIIPLAIGLTVGIFAVSRVLNHIKSVQGTTGTVQTAKIVTAKADIPQGTPVNESMLTIQEVPEGLAPSQHFSDVQEVQERVTAMMIPRDMPILPTMLAPKGTAPGLGSKIPDGMRAVAVRVDEWSAVGGWLKPGVHVDVAAVFSVKSGRQGKTISKIILQNIEVAAVGATMGQNPQDTGANVSRSITLIVKPKDVAKIHLASSKGKIRLAMRGSMDKQSKVLAAQGEDELFGDGMGADKKDGWKASISGFFERMFGEGEPESVQVAQAPKRYTVDLINGGRRVRKVFRGRDSMEEVGFEGSTGAMFAGQAAPYKRRPQPRVQWGAGSASAGSDDGDVSQTE